MLFAYVPILVCILAILSLVGLQAKEKRLDFIIELREWQTALAALVGFLSVIFTINAQATIQRADEKTRSERMLKLIAIEVTGTGADLDAVSMMSNMALVRRKDGDPKGCLEIAIKIKKTTIDDLGLFVGNRENFGLLSLEDAISAAEFYSVAQSVKEIISDLDPNRECTGPEATVYQLDAITKIAAVADKNRKRLMKDYAEGRVDL